MARIIEFLKDWGNGILGSIGLVVSRVLSCPQEILLWLSIVAVLIQLVHSGYKFYRWVRGENQGVVKP